MRGIWPLMLGVFPLAAVAIAAPGTPPVPAAEVLLPVRVEKNIPFATAGGETLVLDMARPDDQKTYPTILLLHGGAWFLKKRYELAVPWVDEAGKTSPSVIEFFAARGYVVASAGYRLVPKHQFPAQLDDARTALQFLRANARKYGLDPDNVAVGGFSAGAHLALLLGLSDPPTPAATTVTTASSASGATEPAATPTRAKCVVSFAGPTDLSLYAATPGLEDAYMVPLLGKACKTDPAVYRRASPLSYVSRDDPPVLMIHGTADVLVPIIHSERLQKKLTDAGVAAELSIEKGTGHGWHGPIRTKTLTDAARYFDRHLKGTK